LFGSVILVMFFIFFLKYTWTKKYMEIHIILFKNRKHVFKHMYQMAPRGVGMGFVGIKDPRVYIGP